MLAKIKDTLRAFPAFGVALWLGYSVTLQMTGSVDKAIERMVVAVVLWVVCALVRAVVCAVPRILTWVTHTLSIRRLVLRRSTVIATRATRLE